MTAPRVAAAAAVLAALLALAAGCGQRTAFSSFAIVDQADSAPIPGAIVIVVPASPDPGAVALAMADAQCREASIVGALGPGQTAYCWAPGYQSTAIRGVTQESMAVPVRLAEYSADPADAAVELADLKQLLALLDRFAPGASRTAAYSGGATPENVRALLESELAIATTLAEDYAEQAALLGYSPAELDADLDDTALLGD